MPIIDSRAAAAAARPKIFETRSQPVPGRVLMVDPAHFDIAYAINPHMKNAAGALNTVDKSQAARQWRALKDTYEKLGFAPCVIGGAPGLPDMVFAANQSFPFTDGRGQAAVVLSRMAAEERRAEVPHFEKWYKSQKYQVFQLEHVGPFEGCGDALWQHPYELVWGGYGFRTQAAVYEELSRRFGWHIVPIELKDPDFYHLDTCLSIINATTAVICQEAFTPASLAIIEDFFPNLISVSRRDAVAFFACNCHSPDGRHVILQKGAADFVAALKKRDLIPIELDLGEFQKSGGSVFCLKMMVY